MPFFASTRIEDNTMPPGIPINSNDWKPDVSLYTYANQNIETVLKRLCDTIGSYDNESLFKNRSHEEHRIQEPYYGDIMEELRIQEPYYGDIMEELRIQAEIEDRRRIQHEWEAYHAAERYHKEVKESHARRIDIYTHYCRQQAHLNVENIVSEKKPRRHYRYRRDRKKTNKKKTNVVV
jgi:hypothetical protein